MPVIEVCVSLVNKKVVCLIIIATPLIWLFAGSKWIWGVSMFLAGMAAGLFSRKLFLGEYAISFDRKAFYAFYLILLCIFGLVGLVVLVL